MIFNSIQSNIKRIGVSFASSSMTLLLCLATSSSYASDIEIYKVPEESVGRTTILLMLDTSGSMNWAMGDGDNKKRIDVLKTGLRDVLTGTATMPRVEDKIVMGLADFGGSNGRILVPARPLGETVRTDYYDIKKPKWIEYEKYFSSTKYYLTCLRNDANNQNCLSWSGESTTKPSGYMTSSSHSSANDCNYGKNVWGSYTSCYTIYENLPQQKVVTQRDELLKEIDNLVPNGGTPTPYAYAEAAAYLMGQSTGENLNRPAYFVSTNNSYLGWYKECVAWNSSGGCTSWVPAGSSWTAGYHYNNAYTRGSYDNLGLAGYYYFGRMAASGFDISVASSKNSTNYIPPTSITEQLNDNDKKTCSGQGIYFLTDGEPEPNGVVPGTDGKSGTAYTIMSKALGNKASLFNCNQSDMGKGGPYKNSNHSWNCVGSFANALLSPDRNPIGLQIKTAVVGFSSGFSANENLDVKEAKLWGTVGGGGSFIGSDSQSVVNSINEFIKSINKDIPSMSTGASVIPTDALNPSVIQNLAYFPQFEPKVNPADKHQVWFGNLKKYYVVNNGVYGSLTGDENSLVVSNGSLNDIKDLWGADLTYGENDTTPVFARYGALNRILWGTNASGITQRKLMTDYVFNNNNRTKDLNLKEIKHTYTKDDSTKADVTYSRALMSLIGYNLTTDVVSNANLNGFDIDANNIQPSVFQIGAPLHSEPVLVTQEGRLKAEKNDITKEVEITSINREDYVVFGTTQGLLHVIDAKTGDEKFAFVPKEIIEKQSETFKNAGGNLNGGKSALYYGMDGEWAAHTEYVTKADGTLTVKEIDKNILGSDQIQKISGKQWLYGGMRMGGRSYYALDLTDIDKPKVKFHIDPDTGKVYSQTTPTGKTFKDIEKMGQSWSKPVIGYINWNGSRKLVMFVGGGYDAGGQNGDGTYVDGVRNGYAGYENYSYNQINQVGAGLYMFDADNGDLLWKASAQNENDTANGVLYVVNPALKYSVGSTVNPVDRNNDGLIDHVYFGDLAGQGFRVDFANDQNQQKKTFDSQVHRILDLNQTDGSSPRFYLPPIFTAHRNAGKPNGANIVIATFVSGNKSSPLLGTLDSPSKTNTQGLKYDGVYAIYDYAIYSGNGGKYPYGLTATSETTRKLGNELGDNASQLKLKYMNNATSGANVSATTGWGGWYYLFKQKMDGSAVGVNGAGAGLIKGLMPLIAMENNLYVSQFDPTNNGTTTSCGAGVKGHTFATRICLPQGICTDNAKYVYNLGPGNVKLNVGPGKSTGTRELVVPDPTNAGGVNGKICEGSGCQGGGFIPAGGPIKFIPNKWYEKYSRVGNG